MTEPVQGLVFYVVFVYSTSFHEAAHAWVALRGGDATAFHAGQVSLNPMPHIRREPIGMVVLPLICVLVSGWPLGFASAPYDPDWARRHPGRAGQMALAGPCANLILVLLAGLAINLGVAAGVFAPPDNIDFADVADAAGGVKSWWHPVGFLIGSVFAVNLLLGIFNLIPVPPLDGSSALVLLLPEKRRGGYQDALATIGPLSLVGIVIAWQLFGPLFSPIFTVALNILYMAFGVSYS